ncbi:imidazoleglycerol-phosphate dehydratase HisB [Marinilactibacillus psychrotolerans]|uniref:Imidazoleglycerol-phosphate dehydratase n=1 Tax=Marinilactibacillus psychrotolerans 42ea TaxID=1255609 RepID=A0A1R4IYC6_9LACT|nr:imidazoleglycerol-phosphate dehydratase HisB [Marinilactibacillus psychrotolerans]GEQ33212.1 imidazoleglycerol-phosphate dehydratase [Marinilactibacillus psychrotolerans]SJN24896.1 Imidazoleglycerol-phosphate dehydratase [Marinilactibacillus psychrotolerans 42ea]
MVIKKERITKETSIRMSVERGLAPSTIDTGVGFLNHMLDLLAFHGHFVFDIQVDGDTDVDDHHTTEDVGILLGQAIAELNVDKAKIQRYGTAYVPMDETLARSVVDVSGRPYLHLEAAFTSQKVGTFDVELVKEFFYAVAINSRITAHLDLIRGGNTHHEIEALFKAFAQSLRIALSDSNIDRIPSSKGVIQE